MGLGYGKGLPVGPDEIEAIEMARERRAFEASLPPLTDEASFEERRRLLEAQEMKDWAFREKQIRKIQTQKLKTLEDSIRSKDLEREAHNNKKIESILNRSVANKDAVIEKIKEQRISVLRKLAKERENVEKKRTKRDIIDDYANFGSRVYAPLTREGRKVDALILQDIKPQALDSSDGISSVEKRIATSTNPKEYSARADALLTLKNDVLLSKQLDTLHESIKDSKSKTPKKLPKPSVAEKVERSTPRPPTPTVVYDDREEDEEQAIIFFQKLLRGRAIQNLMFEGKERRSELIKELKSSQSFVDIDQLSEIRSAVPEITSTDEEQEEFDHLLDEMLGSFVGGALDFMSKELVRVNQERMLNAMVEEAESIRKMREEEESARRKEEKEARDIDDAQFLQIMEIHQKTAETYISQIIEQSKKKIAESNAVIEAKRLAEEEKNQLEKSLHMSPEQIVNELLFGVTFDNVERELERMKQHNENERYFKAAQAMKSFLVVK